MTPSEKAKELVEKFQKEIPDYFAESCAIICCDEILNLPNNEIGEGRYIGDESFWQSVKKQIESL